MTIQIKNKNSIMSYEKNTQFLIGEGIYLYKQKKYSEAVDCFDKAIKINPLYYTAWCNKGVALDKLGKYSEAVDCFDKAIKINPIYYKAWYKKGLALDKLGKYSEEMEWF